MASRGSSKDDEIEETDEHRSMDPQEMGPISDTMGNANFAIPTNTTVTQNTLDRDYD